MVQEVHIVNSLSAVGCLSNVGFSNIFYHALSFEAAVYNFLSYEECAKKWQQSLQSFLYLELQGAKKENDQEIFPFYHVKNTLIPVFSLEKLLPYQNVYVWVSRTFKDHLMLAQVIKFFPHNNIYVFRVYENWSVGEVNEKKIQDCKPKLLNAEEKKVYYNLYEVVCSDNISLIKIFLGKNFNDILQKGAKQFWERLPKRSNGLNKCDELILYTIHLHKEPINQMRIVGKILCLDLFDRFSEGYINHRIERMTNAVMPCLKLNLVNDKKEISINDYGRGLLNFDTNWLDNNQINEQVGGVTINSINEEIVFQEDILS